MQKQWLKLVILSGLSLFSITTYAWSGCMSVPDGWYVEGNIGGSKVSNVNFGGSSTSSDWGGNINLGYKFMPYFGGELGYSRYANTTVNDQFGNRAATVKFYSYDIAGKGILPVFNSGFEFIAKLGVQRMNTQVSLTNSTAAAHIGLSSSHSSTTGLYLGAGGQYYVMPELAVVVQWQRAQGNSSTGNADLYSIGISFILD